MNIVQHGAGIAPTHVKANVDATRDSFMMDHVLGRQDAHVGYIPQAHVAAVGRVEEQIADTGQALARFGRAPYHHIEHLLSLKEATSCNACYQCGCQPAHIARFKSIALGLGEVHLDLHLRHVNLEFRVHISGTVDLREGSPHLLGLAMQDAQIGAEDADNDIIA